jgi:hypothetical protein
MRPDIARASAAIPQALRTEALGLYRSLMRHVTLLPRASHSYYRKYARAPSVGDTMVTLSSNQVFILTNVRRVTQWDSHIRSGFISHRDEDDPDRIRQVIQQSRKDLQWILEKVQPILYRDQSNHEPFRSHESCTFAMQCYSFCDRLAQYKVKP